jgi:hypothetical protein
MARDATACGNSAVFKSRGPLVAQRPVAFRPSLARGSAYFEFSYGIGRLEGAASLGEGLLFGKAANGLSCTARKRCL